MSDRISTPSVRWACWAAVFVWLGACAGADTGERAVIRDSSGITIVENSARAVQQWSLSDSPEVLIGRLEGPGEQQLFRVRGAVRLPDGRIAIANDGSKQIRFFDATGNYVGATGRDGEAPGEFRSVYRLDFSEDSLLVSDSRLDRVSVLGPDGTFVRSFALTRLPETAFPMLAGSFGDGTFLFRAMWFEPGGPRASGLRRDSVAFYRVDRDGVVLDSLGLFPGIDGYVQAEGRRISVMALPFGRSPSSAVVGRHFYFGAADTYEIQVRGMDGAIERLVRLDRPPRAVSPDDIERAKEQLLDEADDEDRPLRERALANMRFPSTMPAYSGFDVDRQGNLWVGDFRAPSAPDEEPTAWTVFDAEGRVLAEIDMPPQFRIFDIAADWVLGVRTDELGVEHVELYRVRRAPS